jgi:hypothetical protein
VVTRRLFVVAAVLAFAGCALDKQNAPDFAGPSEFSLATAIDVTALGADSNPVAGLALRFRLTSAFGSLSTTAVTTNGSGRASVVYTAPSNSPVDQLVTIEITPTGSNAQNMRSRTVAVRVRS